MPRLKLLGVNVDIMEEDEMMQEIFRLSKQNYHARIVLLNKRLLMSAKFHKELFNIINSADLVIPVSKSIRNGLNFLSKKAYSVLPAYRQPILTPFSFAIHLLSYFTEIEQSVYLLGGSKKLIKGAEKNVKDSYPGIKLMGVYHTKYKKDFEQKLLTSIYKIAPNLLIISKKNPKAEYWLSKQKEKLPSGVSVIIEDFIYEIGEKIIKPTDRIRYALHKKIKNFFSIPSVIIRHFLFITYLFNYKIFNLENKVKKEKIKINKKKEKHKKEKIKFPKEDKNRKITVTNKKKK